MTRVGISEVKTTNLIMTDAHIRKDGKQMGLVTHVVHPVNGEYSNWGFI